MERKSLTNGLLALTVEDERKEVMAVLNGKGDTPMSDTERIVENWFRHSQTGDTFAINGVTLRRSFNQEFPDMETLRFARVIAPSTHKNFESDLSIEGMRRWGII